MFYLISSDFHSLPLSVCINKCLCVNMFVYMFVFFSFEDFTGEIMIKRSRHCTIPMLAPKLYFANVYLRMTNIVNSCNCLFFL